MKQVTFTLSQSNGTRVNLGIKSLETGITQDDFSGTYVFPALMTLVKGSSNLFDKSLPVALSFEAEIIEGEIVAKMLAKVVIKSKSAHAIRRAVMVFNEAIAALVAPTSRVSIYDLVDMKADKGGQFRRYAKSLLRPSVSLEKAIAN